MLKFFIVPVLLSVITLTAIGQRDGAEDRFLARAGRVFISEEEFLRRFELLPGLYRQRKPQLQQAKLDLLISMIAEKLLAQEAQQRGLELDSLYKSALLDVRKLLARDELYHKEVSERVTVTRDEIHAGIKQALRQVLVEFYFFEKESDARFVRSQMRTPEDFGRIVIDSTISFLRDTATVIWGDAEPAIESAAYKLHEGEISNVVRAEEGYYILRHAGSVPSTFYSSMQPHVLRERIMNRIRARKEHERLLAVIPQLLRGKTAYSRPTKLRVLSEALLLSLSKENPGEDSALYVNKAVHTNAALLCAEALGDTLTVAGDIAWSVQDVLDKLLAQGFRVKAADLKKLPLLLNTELEYRAQQELLSQEGIRRGLDESPNVKKRMSVWQEAYLADLLKLTALKRVNVSEAEVFSYMNSRDTSLRIPRVRIRELQTTSLDAMNEALQALESGISFEAVVRQFSVDESLKQRGGVTDFFPITARHPIGPLAAQMEIGQRYGPLRMKDRVVYFELLEKEMPATASDTAWMTRKSEAENELLEMKKRRFTSMVIAQLAEKHGFEIYQDRLLKLEVSPIPMLAYRLLGFGGRMFEVPFVDPQLDWIEIEPPKEILLP